MITIECQCPVIHIRIQEYYFTEMDELLWVIICHYPKYEEYFNNFESMFKYKKRSKYSQLIFHPTKFVNCFDFRAIPFK